ncbi:MAG: DoxX family protein, partial [Nocardioidaceae bacterium]
MTLLRVAARPMLASMFIVGGINAIKNAPAMAPKAKPVTDKIVPTVRKAVPQVPIPEDTTTLVRANGVV